MIFFEHSLVSLDLVCGAGPGFLQGPALFPKPCNPALEIFPYKCRVFFAGLQGFAGPGANFDKKNPARNPADTILPHTSIYVDVLNIQ